MASPQKWALYHFVFVFNAFFVSVLDLDLDNNPTKFAPLVIKTQYVYCINNLATKHPNRYYKVSKLQIVQYKCMVSWSSQNILAQNSPTFHYLARRAGGRGEGGGATLHDFPKSHDGASPAARQWAIQVKQQQQYVNNKNF